MPEQVCDKKGWPIVSGARVRVSARQGLDGCGEIAGFGGLVLSVSEHRVDIEEFGSFNRRSVRPDQVTVQRGESRVSREHKKLREKF